MPKNVAKVAVFNDKNQILLLKRSPTAPSRPLTWDLPGGVANKGEATTDTAIREVKEETAIKLKSVTYAFGTRKNWGNKWVYFYSDDNVKTEVTISWEHTEFIWQNLADLADLKDLPEFLYIDLQNLLKIRD